MSPRILRFTLLGALSLATVQVHADEVATKQQAAESTNPAEQATAPASTKKTLNPDGTSLPVKGAFGIELGAPFTAESVKQVISEEGQTYRDRSKAEHTGKLYVVEPLEPDAHFDRYEVSTSADGLVYEIRGSYEDPEKQNLCKQTKEIADGLTGTYGPPRGKGMLGEWYVFRDTRVDHYRGIRLFAPKCRVGRYSIVYRDEGPLQVEKKPAE